MLKSVITFFMIGIFLAGCTGDVIDGNCVRNPLTPEVCLNPNPPLPVTDLEINYIGSDGNFHTADRNIKVGEHVDFKARAIYSDGYTYDVTDKVNWATNNSNPAYRWDNSVNGRLVGVHQGSLLPIQIKFESNISNEVIVNIGD